MAKYDITRGRHYINSPLVAVMRLEELRGDGVAREEDVGAE